MRSHFYSQGIMNDEYQMKTISNRIENTVSDFIHDNRYNLSTFVRMVRGRSANKRPIYECEIKLVSDSIRFPIFIKKVDENFWKAIISASSVLRKILRRTSKMKRHHSSKIIRDVNRFGVNNKILNKNFDDQFENTYSLII